MLTIWGRTNSINVQKVMWCVGELGLEHVRVDAGHAFGLNAEPWYREMNPNGLVPCINDHGFTLWESNAIVRYLAARYGAGSLWPEEVEARADADRWMDWQATTLLSSVNTVFRQLVRTPEAERDEALIARGRDAARPLLEILDRRLADRPFLAGEKLTMGDIPAGAVAWRWYALPIERPSFRNLEAWYARLQERPAYRQHVMLPLS